ncbi:hypothetical protein PN4B1_00590 [Paenibacillus naphthalenovorans]|uniref:RraA family protein n=1 Tax=Paenibacillus naphthalenovorans TaxID=162209 RepID=UPI0010B39124|nr:RraA family protein [Paenibacillus naphthalenovorans]GCL70159.1 hypothetical protein PN4B1_00590 [Paenibacillus naphthalenovorans]
MKEPSIIGGIGFGFIETFDRADAALIQQLQHASSTDVTDSQNRTGAMDPGIKPLGSGKRVWGSAVTVDLPANDNLMLYKALQLAQPGDVLVVNTNGGQRRAVWGELMTHTAMALALGGLVVDGIVRDGAAIRRLDFPVFCRGTAPVSVEKNGPGLVNGEMTCGGVVVRPGDLVVGDDDGVVIIQRERLSSVLDKMKQTEQREIKRKEEIARGQALPAWLDSVMREKGLVPGIKKERLLE